MPRTTALHLVERDGELGRLAEAVEDARAGRGSLVVVEGPAGQGKTTLLREARTRAAEDGMRVLAAAGAPVERAFAFGVARQLFEPVLAEADEAGREDLLRGAARLVAGAVGGDASGEPPIDAQARLHGLFWLCANLAERGPLLVVVDDAHWADAPSLRFLDVLARRIEDLPVALVVASRPAEPGAEHDLLDALALRAASAVLRPADLTERAVAAIVEEALGGPADPAFAAACAASTGGSPFLVAELAAMLTAGGFTGAQDEADAVRRAVPETISRSMLARLRALSPQALSTARAVAVLGDEPRLAHVAALAGASHDEAVRAHAALAHATVLERARIAFVHPMVREALLAGTPAGERAQLHRRAAALLAEAGAPGGEVAAHLAETQPDGDAWVAEVLAETGRRTLAQGAPDIAHRLLARALAEPPPEAARPAVLLALGEAGAAAGDAAALEHLGRAADTGSPEVAAAADRSRAALLVLSDRAEEAAAVLRAALERGVPDELAGPVEEILLSALDYDAQLVEEKRERLAVASDRPVALAHRALDAALTGASQATVVDLARRALADGSLIDGVGEERISALYAIEALMVAEAAEDAARAHRLADEVVRRSGSRLAAGTIAMQRTRWEMLFGDLGKAEAEAEMGIELWTESLGEDLLSPAAWIALGTARLERGDLAGAEEAAAKLPATERSSMRFHGIPVLRARLRLAQRHPEEALALLDEQFAVERRRGWIISPRHNARAVQVAALADAGRPEEALAVAREHAAAAGARGSFGMQAPILVAAARALPTGEAIGALEEAVAVARRSPMPRNVAHALAALGAAQRRGGHRVEARDTLREARELAHRVGAHGLEAQVLEELVIAGGRPQRIALDGVDALTPAERRVAELAAGGLRNRDIAETLFVTLKTVEVHLGRAYTKLGIQGRSQLEGALARTERAPGEA